MRRLAAAAVTIVALVGGGVAVVSAPDDTAISGPIPVTGALGHRIVGRAFDATALDLTFGDRLETTDGRTVSTPGVWLRVRVRVTRRFSLGQFDQSVIRVGSTSYAAYSTTGDLAAGVGNPGITVEGDLLFELPRSVADEPGAQLVLDRGSGPGPTLIPDQITVVPFRPDGVRHETLVRVMTYALVTTERT